MDAAIYTKMLSDSNMLDLKKMQHKFSSAEVVEFIALLKKSVYKTLPLLDFNAHSLVYMDSVAQVRLESVKLLLTAQDSKEPYGAKAMEDEISSTFTIEDIDFTRDSVRKILKGLAPADKSEDRIFGMKKGLEFICDRENKIIEKSIYELYQLAIGQYLEDDDRLTDGNLYRHDSVYIVGQNVEHIGLPYKKLPEYMQKLVAFINEDGDINDLLKAAVIHFYIAYLHPYFDGNGRMARLMQLWYLVQRGYSSTMFIPFSSYIERSRKDYYRAYSLIEDNAKISKVIDITPFLVYFVNDVYNKIDDSLPKADTLDAFSAALDKGLVTAKEKDLWNFVLSAYGSAEFSTKQLEKDFGNAAYATIRGFALKFSDLRLLDSTRYGNRVKYHVKL